MAETNSCESCGFLEVKSFDMTKLEVEVIPDDQVAEGVREMRRLGRKSEIKKKTGPTKRDKKLRKIMKELLILLGHGQHVNSIPEAVATLFVQNYPELVEWNGQNKLVIFIPEFYLSKAFNYVDPNRVNEVLENLYEAQVNRERRYEFKEHEDALLGAKRVHAGKVPNVNMFNTLKERFDNGSETVAVFNDLKIMKLDLEQQANNVYEKDFIIVSETYRYIAGIDCMRTFGTEGFERRLQQLYDTKSDLEIYLKSGILPDGTEITSDWIFVPLIYCEELRDGMNLCDACDKHIIQGK